MLVFFINISIGLLQVKVMEDSTVIIKAQKEQSMSSLLYRTVIFCPSVSMEKNTRLWVIFAYLLFLSAFLRSGFMLVVNNVVRNVDGGVSHQSAYKLVGRSCGCRLTSYLFQEKKIENVIVYWPKNTSLPCF